MTEPTFQDRKPNYRDKYGHLFLVRCYNCSPIGIENWNVIVAQGRCAWCGWVEEQKEDDKQGE